MENRKYMLVASTRQELSAHDLMNDPLNKNSKPFLHEAENESEAITFFQSSEFYRLFCEKHINECVYTHIIEDGENAFRRADKIPSAIENEE